MFHIVALSYHDEDIDHPGGNARAGIEIKDHELFYRIGSGQILY